MTNSFNGISINLTPIDIFIDQLADPNFAPSHIHLAAGSTFVATASKVELKHILNQGKVLLDSRPISYFLNHTGNPVPQIRGTDFMRKCLDRFVHQKGFFLGSSEDNLEALRHLISTHYPKYEVVGTSAAILDSTFLIPEHVLSEISLSGADIVWVGLGSPKQDFVASQITASLQITTIAVGAAFDIITGRVQEAPRILQNLGLEWLFRLLIEPKRLFKRYAVGNSILLYMMLREFLAGKNR